MKGRKESVADEKALAKPDGTLAVDKLRYIIPSVAASVRVLQYLSQSKHQNASLTQISQELGLNRSTTYRILTTLQMENIVEYDDRERGYRLGPELAVLGARAVSFSSFLHRAEELINRIAEQTQNTTLLVQRVSRDKIGYVLKAEPDAPIHISAVAGQVIPITAGSHGKVFMAFMDSEEREALLKAWGLPNYTPRSIHDEAAFYVELERVRKTHIAVSWEEHFPGICGVAVPVFRNGSDHVIATVTTIAMTAATTPEQLEQWGELIKSAIAKELG